MAKVNNFGYVERGDGRRITKGSIVRNWWLVKIHCSSDTGRITLGAVCFPKEYMGKRVRFKIEILE